MSTATATKTSLEASYLALIEFLMLSKREVVEHGNHYGMSSMQAMTLILLDRPSPMNRFKKIFNCDASNVTGLVDGLEEKSYAVRYESSSDRRLKMVKLTQKGSGVRTTLLNEITGPHSYVHAKLTPAEVQTFIRLVNKITAD